MRVPYTYRERVGAQQRFTINPEMLADQFPLLANTSVSTIVEASARVRLTFLRESGEAIAIERDVPASSRYNVYANNDVPGLTDGERFGVVIESLPVAEAPDGVPISVERAMYWDAGTQHWAGGTNATAVKLP